MITIEIATVKNAELLTNIGKTTFIESHGHSAPEKDVFAYRDTNFCIEKFEKELADANNLYHIIYFNNQAAGYSKIILNSPNKNIDDSSITMLERLYVLKEFYNHKLGYQLLQFNIGLAKLKKQNGIWLNVWVENHRAIKFYKKTGFIITGEYSFKVSATHSNPNHQMFLAF